MDDKAQDGAAVAVSARRGGGYKSWKKKYRKMRIVFDRKMQQGEELHRREDKASATVKRLAVENDRLLDLLLEVNNSPQIPPERRIDLSLAAAADDDTHDREPPLKRLAQLLGGVPHSSYAAAKEARAPYMADLDVAEGEARPSHFLSADDVDNYIYAVDSAIDPDSHLPSLAPRAHAVGGLASAAAAAAASHPHLKNPISVTNWLRKNAPKIFLQDSEHSGGGAADADDGEGGAVAGAHAQAAAGRKARPGPAGGGGRVVPKGKKTTAAAAARLAAGDVDASMDDEGDPATTPGGRGGKRKRDDDPGYRPSKKKRKSEGGEPTPPARRSKKVKDAIAAAAPKDDQAARH